MLLFKAVLYIRGNRGLAPDHRKYYSVWPKKVISKLVLKSYCWEAPQKCLYNSTVISGGEFHSYTSRWR